MYPPTQKFITLTILLLMSAVATTVHAQDPVRKKSLQTTFLQPNTWWNFYFDSERDPLKRGSSSIHAVKIVETDSLRPSWVRIAFPKIHKEHLSIFGPAARAGDDEKINLEDALAEWEKGISKWNVMWVNLRFVTRITKVEQFEDGLNSKAR